MALVYIQHQNLSEIPLGAWENARRLLEQRLQQSIAGLHFRDDGFYSGTLKQAEHLETALRGLKQLSITPLRIGERRHWPELTIFVIADDTLVGPEVALRRLVEQGEGSLRLYDTSFHARCEINRPVERAVEEDLERGSAGARMVFRPIVELATGKIRGAHVAVRVSRNRTVALDQYLDVARNLGALERLFSDARTRLLREVEAAPHLDLVLDLSASTVAWPRLIKQLRPLMAPRAGRLVLTLPEDATDDFRSIGPVLRSGGVAFSARGLPECWPLETLLQHPMDGLWLPLPPASQAQSRIAQLSNALNLPVTFANVTSEVTTALAALGSNNLRGAGPAFGQFGAWTPSSEISPGSLRDITSLAPAPVAPRILPGTAPSHRPARRPSLDIDLGKQAWVPRVLRRLRHPAGRRLFGESSQVALLDALAAIERELELCAENTPAWIDLSVGKASCLYLLGDLSALLAFATQAIHSAGGIRNCDPQLTLFAALCFGAKGALQDAIDIYGECLANATDDYITVRALNGLIATLLSVGAPEDALAAFDVHHDTLLNVAPMHEANLLANACVAAHEAGEEHTAARLWRRLSLLSPQDPRIQVLADFCFALRLAERPGRRTSMLAVQATAKAQGMSFLHEEAASRAARDAAEDQDYAAAVAIFERYLEERWYTPDSLVFHRLLSTIADCHERLGNLPAALRAHKELQNLSRAQEAANLRPVAELASLREALQRAQHSVHQHRRTIDSLREELATIRPGRRSTPSTGDLS